MIKVFLLLIVGLQSLTCYSGVIKWDGDAGNGLWSSPANWTGDQLPGAGDDVVIDNSVVGGNFTVSLPPGNTGFTMSSLMIIPQDGNSIILLIPVQNTASPCLSITGIGDALILHAGGILKNSSGASSGSTLVVVNTFRIDNGGRYIHNTARGNATIVSQLSTASGTEYGEVEFDVPGAVQTLSLTGRSYGTLILSSTAHGGPVTYSGNGSSMLQIRGDLRINTGVTFSLGLAANCIVSGNLQQASSSTFNVQNATHNNLIRIQGNISAEGMIHKTGTGQPLLELNGTHEQFLAIRVSPQNLAIRVNNAAGVHLGSPLTISHHLQFLNGIIHTTAENLLVFADGAGCSGATAASFVDGPVKKTGDDNFEFPIGTGEIYAPVAIAGSGSNTDEYTAAYKRQNPQSTPGLGNTVSGSLHHISSSEYWELSGNAGSSPKKIRLTASAYSFAKNLQSLLVARYDGSRWQNEGGANFLQGPSAAPYITGSVESLTEVAAAGAFTIATTDNHILNPLPVKIISFSAQLQPGRQASIEWVLTEACDPSVQFELQKAGVDHQFEKVEILLAKDVITRYVTRDISLVPGLNQYRLKITDEHGLVSYSSVASVMNGLHETMLVVIAPAIVTGNTKLLVTSDADQQVSMLVHDQGGRIIVQKHVTVLAGKTTIDVASVQWRPGMYHVSLVNRQGYRTRASFIRQ